jgi:Flp pilus assembly protein TadG
VQKSSDDHGAVLLIFTVLLSSGLLIALLALVFDSGSIFSERRVVQNSADLSALALAQECAIDGTGEIVGSQSPFSSPVCSNQVNALSFSAYYANQNSPDLLTAIDGVCGKTPLNPCPSQKNILYECKDVNPKYVNYVRVETSSLSSQGPFIKLLFSPIVDSIDNVKTTGCSNVAWGKADKAPLYFPFAVPICNFPSSLPKDVIIIDYKNAINCTITDLDGKSFPYVGVPDGLFVMTEYKNNLNQFVSFGCPNSSNAVTLKVGDSVKIETSLQQVEQACSRINVDFRTLVGTYVGKNLFLPVITEIACNSNTNNCGNFTAPIATFVSFKLKGAILKGGNTGVIGASPATSWPADCTNTSKIQVCLYGQYVKSIVPGAGVSTDPNFPALGAQAVQMLP